MYRALLFAFPLLIGAVAMAQQAPAGPKKAATAADLVKKLGDESYDVREKATKDLIAMGKAAVPALEEALKSNDLEVRLRAGHALRAIQSAQEKSDGAAPSSPLPTPNGGRLPAGTSRSVSVDMANGQVKVTIRTKDASGKEQVSVYKGKSLDEIRKAHPEIRDVLGGLQIHTGSLDDSIFSDRDKQFLHSFDKQWGKDFFDHFNRDGFTKDFQDDMRRSMEQMRRLQDEFRKQFGSPATGLRGTLQRNQLGVRVSRPDAVLDDQLQLGGKGLVVQGIERGSLAERLGLHRYDILLDVDGQPIAQAGDIASALSKTPGAGHSVTVLRHGKPVELK